MKSANLNKIKPIVYSASALYFFLIIYIVFLARRRRGRFIPLHERLNLQPFAEKWEYLSDPSLMKGMGRFNFYSDLIGNILLFIPLSMFLIFVLEINNYKKVLLLSMITSIGIETIQFVLNIGVADIDDVILNTTGAILGVLLSVFLKKLKWV